MKTILLLDGGMGQELNNRGISDGSFLAGVLANEDSVGNGANVVESIHYDFLSAGCDVITTNSFVAVPPRMLECGLASNETRANESAAKLITAAVDRAKAAIATYNQIHGEGGEKGRPKRVAGCVPPITECYFAEKVPQTDTLIPGYVTIMSTLIESGVDILLAETLSTLREAKAIIKALSYIQSAQQHNCKPSLWISFTVDDDQPTQLRSGELISGVCQSVVKEASLLNISIEAIGVNCSTPSAISVALGIFKKELDGSHIEFICYGNCFQTTTSEWIRSLNNINTSISCGEAKPSCCEEYDANGYLLPEAYARYANDWAEAGATIIGGCCGCSPKHLKSVASTLRKKVNDKL